MIELVRTQIGCVADTRTASAIERSLARYPVRQQARIHVLAARHPRLADLAATFPGLLFALAEREGSCARAIDLTVHGAPLKAVALAAGVPLWLRKLPPEAFELPLGRLPDGEMFRRRIANQLPRSPKRAAAWLAAVRMAADWSDDDLAVWIARELQRGCRVTKPERLRLLSLYAWFSRRPQAPAHRFLRTPWHPCMRYERALAGAEAWREGVALGLDLTNNDLDPWLEPTVVMGFEFTPLLTAAAIAQEAQAMRNCVQQFGYSIARGRERLWSIRRDGERVATLSVGFRGRPILDILQLLGPGNLDAPKAAWVAALRWIDRHDLMAIENASLPSEAPLDRATWVALWRPYWLAKRRIPSWLPLAPDRSGLERLALTGQDR